jgi:hypothetical protein
MSPKRKRIVKVFCGGVIIVVAALYGLTQLPSPAPKVALKFAGFSRTRTNVVALINFTNEGSKSVWWYGEIIPDANISLRIPTIASRFSYEIHPGTGFTFPVTLPEHIQLWNVRAKYGYYDRWPGRIEMPDWLWHFSQRRPPSSLFWQVASWVSRFLPVPEEKTGEASCDFITNALPEIFRTNGTPVAK